MAYVDGVFSDRRSKRWALAFLGLAMSVSFAIGVARNVVVPPPPVPAIEKVEAPVYPKEAQPILQAEAALTAPPVKARSRPAPVETPTITEALAPVGEPAEVVAVTPAPEPEQVPDTPAQPPTQEEPPL
jgi:hypothetical protein